MEGPGVPHLSHATTHNAMHNAAADKEENQGGSTRAPTDRAIRTSGCSARISGGAHSRGGYGSGSSRIAPSSRTVGDVETGITALRKEGDTSNAPPGLKLLGVLADEAGEDVLEVWSSVMLAPNIY